jgi:hypothetical protein
MLVYYEQLHQNRRDYVERMWGTVQYFTTAITSLLTIAIGASLVVVENEATLSVSTGVFARAALSLICVIATGLGFFGLNNLKRESENEYVQMGLILIAERYLGLHNKIPRFKRFFQKEDQLIRKFIFLPLTSLPNLSPVDLRASGLDDFVKLMISKKRSFYRTFSKVFVFLLLLSLLLSVLFAFWAVALYIQSLTKT